jgi:hypothetical protein
MAYLILFSGEVYSFIVFVLNGGSFFGTKYWGFRCTGSSELLSGFIIIIQIKV